MPMHKVQLATLAALLALAPAVHADVYKWIDDKGVVNYSNTPPASRKSVKLDEEQGRVSTIEAYDYSKSGAARREQVLQERVARLEQEVALGRQTAAQDAAAAAEAYRVWREQCIAQRRVDCDGPYVASFIDPGVIFPGAAVRPPRRVAGAYIPTDKIAIGVGGVVGPYFKPPPGGIVVGPGPYGIGGGYQRAAPGGVVLGPGPYGIGAAFHPVPEEMRPVRPEPRGRPRR
ncbi:MAG TPA: DUF4124 domain-containing protein [Burkholderiales bacterium]|nr:DUF4124 domain-containing protein [Burkholderiales bacterium]